MLSHFFLACGEPKTTRTISIDVKFSMTITVNIVPLYNRKLFRWRGKTYLNSTIWNTAHEISQFYFFAREKTSNVRHCCVLAIVSSEGAECQTHLCTSEINDASSSKYFNEWFPLSWGSILFQPVDLFVKTFLQRSRTDFFVDQKNKKTLTVELDPEYSCPVCLDVLQDPVILVPCG